MTGRFGRALTGGSARSHPRGRLWSPPVIDQTCESCGREFACGAHDGACWCTEVVLEPDRRAILREHFERCLCPDCLAVAAREASRDVSD
jgi:Cysteine-rich CWC